VMYLVLSPFDNEQSDLVHRVHQDIVLDELPVYWYVSISVPPVWVRGCRIGPLRFLAGWRTRRLNQGRDSQILS